jgi:hypothetical protein
MDEKLLIYDISDNLGRFSINSSIRPNYTFNSGEEEDRKLAYDQFLNFGSFWAETNYNDLTDKQKELLIKVKELQYITINIFANDIDFNSLNEELRFALVDFTENGKRTILLVDSSLQIYPRYTTEIVNYPLDFLDSFSDSSINGIKKDLIDSAFLDKEGRNEKLSTVILKIDNLSEEVSEEQKELLRDIVHLLIFENLGIKTPAQTKTKTKAKVIKPEPEIKVITPEPELEDEIIDFEALMEQELDFSSMMDDILNEN